MQQKSSLLLGPQQTTDLNNFFAFIYPTSCAGALPHKPTDRICGLRTPHQTRWNNLGFRKIILYRKSKKSTHDE